MEPAVEVKPRALRRLLRALASHGILIETVSDRWRLSLTGELLRGTHWLELERVMGIEPTLAAWEAAVLPLNYTRARS